MTETKTHKHTRTVMPGVSASTTKPVKASPALPSPVFAMTKYQSATPPLVIHCITIRQLLHNNSNNTCKQSDDNAPSSGR